MSSATLGASSIPVGTTYILIVLVSWDKSTKAFVSSLFYYLYILLSFKYPTGLAVLLGNLVFVRIIFSCYGKTYNMLCKLS